MDTFGPTPKKPIGRPRLGPNNTRKYEDKEVYNDYQNNYYHKHLSKKSNVPFVSGHVHFKNFQDTSKQVYV